MPVDTRRPCDGVLSIRRDGTYSCNAVDIGISALAADGLVAMECRSRRRFTGTRVGTCGIETTWNSCLPASGNTSYPGNPMVTMIFTSLNVQGLTPNRRSSHALRTFSSSDGFFRSHRSAIMPSGSGSPAGRARRPRPAARARFHRETVRPGHIDFIEDPDSPA